MYSSLMNTGFMEWVVDRRARNSLSFMILALVVVVIVVAVVVMVVYDFLPSQEVYKILALKV
jgi:Tfp pilus assembly protein PilN